MARLWHTSILAQWKPSFEFIPFESQMKKFQSGYSDAIARCHIDGESTVFIEFMTEQVDAVLTEILRSDTFLSSEISKYVSKLLSVMLESMSYFANELPDLLNIKSKETLRKNYLTPATNNGLVKMTLPDKLKSKKQRYIKIENN